MDIKSFDEVPHYLKFLLYGDSGAGKTVLSSTAPKPLIVSAEGGLVSLAQFDRKPDVVVIDDFRQLREVRTEVEANPGRWETLVIDSLTEIQRKSMETIMRAVTERDSRRDPDVPGIGEYGKNAEVIRKVVRAFRDMPMHVVFTALAQDVTDAGTGVPTTRPALTGRMALEVPQYMDVVGYLAAQKITEEGKEPRIVRKLLLEHTGQGGAIAKTRLDLPRVIEDPNISDMIATIGKKSKK